MTAPVGADLPWFVPLVEDRDRPWQVLAMPQAGAGCATFAECADLLGPDIALYGLNLPGRQARFLEPPVTDLDELVAEVTSGVRACADRPYVLFGYCSGALLAFLVAHAARAAAMPTPHALVVGSYPAPQHARPARDLHRAPPDEFWRELISQGGFTAELLRQEGYRELFEPALRADYQVFSTYRYAPLPPLDVPVVAVVGRHDPGLSESAAADWAAQTRAGFRCETVDSDHWLLERACDQVARVLERECRR